MSHWDVARSTLYGAYLAICAFAGYTLGGLVY